jgi:hypothetical protein
MTTIDVTPEPSGRYAYRDDRRDGYRDSHRNGPGMFARAEMWLDERGKWAWIGATVAGFILFWPVGLAILAYMIWSKRMFNHDHHHRSEGRWASRSCRSDRSREMFRNARAAMRPSGNEAFDAYKHEMLKRLEDEQTAFEEFLGRLRAAKDKAEFDQFMEDRARRAAEPRPAEDRGDA